MISAARSGVVIAAYQRALEEGLHLRQLLAAEGHAQRLERPVLLPGRGHGPGVDPTGL